MAATPPTVPPTMAPTGVLFFGVDVTFGLGAGVTTVVVALAGRSPFDALVAAETVSVEEPDVMVRLGVVVEEEVD